LFGLVYGLRDSNGMQSNATKHSCQFVGQVSQLSPNENCGSADINFQGVFAWKRGKKTLLEP